MNPAAEAVGYALQGSLGSDDVRALFERCASLRFTGVLELSDGPRTASVPFVEGEPLSGPDLFKLGAVWRRGDYRLVQRAVDLQGNLTDGVTLEGALGETTPAQLFRHCEESRLSGELDLAASDGQSARVRFTRGRVESAEVNGQPNMSALGTVSAWSGGTFKLTLSPLFESKSGASARPTGSDKPPTAATAQSAQTAQTARTAKPASSEMFDITSKVPLWQVEGEEDKPSDVPPADAPAPAPVATAAPSTSTAGVAARPSLFSSKSKPGVPAVGAPRPSPTNPIGLRPGATTTRPSLPGLGGAARPAPSFGRPATGPATPPPDKVPATPPPGAAVPRITPLARGGSTPLGDGGAASPRPALPARSASSQPATPPARTTLVDAVVPPPSSPPVASGWGADSAAAPLDSEWESTVESSTITAALPVPTPALVTATPRVPTPVPVTAAPHVPTPVPDVAMPAAEDPAVVAKAPARQPEAASTEAAAESDGEAAPEAPAPAVEPPLPAQPKQDAPAEASVISESPFMAPPESPVPRPALPSVPLAPPPPLSVGLPVEDAPFRPRSIAPMPAPARPSEPSIADADTGPLPLAPPPEEEAPPPALVATFDAPPAAPRPRARNRWVAAAAVGVAAVVAIFLLWPRGEQSPAPPFVEVTRPPPVAPPPPAAKPPAAVGAPAAPAKMDDAQRFILAARKATIEGKKAEALKLFRAAFNLNKKDPAFAIYVPMTLGKTGKARLLLEGTGTIVVDGHAFTAPKKLSVAAGPHTVEVAGKSDEITLEKGGTQRVSAPAVLPVAAPEPAAAPMGKPIKDKAKLGKVKPGKGKHKALKGA